MGSTVFSWVFPELLEIHKHCDVSGRRFRALGGARDPYSPQDSRQGWGPVKGSRTPSRSGQYGCPGSAPGLHPWARRAASLQGSRARLGGPWARTMSRSSKPEPDSLRARGTAPASSPRSEGSRQLGARGSCRAWGGGGWTEGWVWSHTCEALSPREEHSLPLSMG